MFNSIRNAIANAIAPNRPALMIVADNAKTLSSPNAPAHALNQAERVSVNQPLVGHFNVSDVTDLDSQRLKDAVASLGAWSALARAFSEFTRVYGMRNANDSKLHELVNEFHAWNATAEKQMDDEQTEEIITRLAVVAPSKGSKQTDEIIARVRGISIEDVRADRIKKADAKTAKRIEMIDTFNTLVWSFVYSDNDYSLPAAKVLGKAIQTLEWVAGWDSQDPASQAAELLLIESDIKRIKYIATLDRENSEDFQDGVLTSDGMMRINER